MTRSIIRRRRRWPSLLLFAAIIGMLTYLAVQFFPYGFAAFTGQPYLNPRVKTKTDETYILDVWVKLPALVDTTPAREMLEHSITEFGSRQPNYEINVSYLPEAKAMEALQIALANGTPPDLFFHADSSQAYFGELQLPLEIYLTPEARQAWPDAVWQQAVVDKRANALPVALFPRVMLVNMELWQPNTCGPTEVAATGWTWEQFLQCINEVRTDRSFGFVPTSTGEALLASLLATWGQPAAFNNDGTPSWTKEYLLTLAEAWNQLSQCEAVPTPSSSMDQDCLSLFLNKKTAAIGPLNHHLAKWIWESAVAKGITPALLPMPNQTGNSDLHGVYLSAFRQTEFKGQRHTKATAELAIYLATELAKQMQQLTGAVPAQTHLITDADFPYAQDSLAVYADLSKALPVAYEYGPEPGMAPKHWGHTIAPAWEDYVNGYYTADEFAEAILTGLARATIAGP